MKKRMLWYDSKDDDSLIAVYLMALSGGRRASKKSKGIKLFKGKKRLKIFHPWTRIIRKKK
jgi:hypothetical protein